MVVVGDSMWQNEKWKRGRVVEGARLEIVWAAMSRRVESSRFRQEVRMTRKGYFFVFFDSPCVGYFFMRIYEVLFQRCSNTIRYPCQ